MRKLIKFFDRLFILITNLVFHPRRNIKKIRGFLKRFLLKIRRVEAKVIEGLQKGLLPALAIYLISQLTLLIIKGLCYNTLPWKYTLIPLWLILCYMSILLVLAAIKGDFNNDSNTQES